jgi:hypothetical protein
MLGGTRGHAFKDRAETQFFDAKQVGAGSTENSAKSNPTGAVRRGDIVWNNVASKQLFSDGIINVFADS